MGRVKDMFFTDREMEYPQYPEPDIQEDEDDDAEYVYSAPIIADRKLYDSDELPF